MLKRVQTINPNNPPISQDYHTLQRLSALIGVWKSWTLTSLCFVFPITFEEGAPSGHQAGAARGRVHVGGQADGGDPVRQHHRGGQLHQGDVVVKGLGVELEATMNREQG